MSQEVEIKSIQIRKEEIKMSLFPDDVFFYVRNPRDSTKKAIRTGISEFSMAIRLMYKNQFYFCIKATNWKLKILNIPFAETKIWNNKQSDKIRARCILKTTKHFLETLKKT